MDEYREQCRRHNAVPLGAILADHQEEGEPSYGDGKKITVAGVVASVKTKTTKNNSMMAYVTLEDASGSIEMLAFSRTLSECGSYLKAGQAVIVAGRISVRDEKEPQIMVDRISPLNSSDVDRVHEPPKKAKTLWIKLENGAEQFRWLGKLLDMFPGKEPAIVYLADTKKRFQTNCVIHDALIAELTEVLGETNVVLK